MQTQTEATTVEKILFSKRDTAAALSVSKRKVDYLIAAKVLRATRIGRRALIHRREIENWRGRVRDSANECSAENPSQLGCPEPKMTCLSLMRRDGEKGYSGTFRNPVVFDR